LPGIDPIQGVVRWHGDGLAGIAFHRNVCASQLAAWLLRRRANLGHVTIGTLGLLTGSLPSTAPAQTAPSNMSVSATVVESCTISSHSEEARASRIGCPSAIQTRGQNTSRARGAAAGERDSTDGYLTISF
jgi:hypothetical protein